MTTDPADEKIPLINDPVRLLDGVLDEAKILLDKKPYLSTHTTSDVVSLALSWTPDLGPLAKV
jgi:hypothetical protein